MDGLIDKGLGLIVPGRGNSRQHRRSGVVAEARNIRMDGWPAGNNHQLSGVRRIRANSVAERGGYGQERSGTEALATVERIVSDLRPSAEMVQFVGLGGGRTRPRKVLAFVSILRVSAKCPFK